MTLLSRSASSWRVMACRLCWPLGRAASACRAAMREAFCMLRPAPAQLLPHPYPLASAAWGPSRAVSRREGDNICGVFGWHNTEPVLCFGFRGQFPVMAKDHGGRVARLQCHLRHVLGLRKTV